MLILKINIRERNLLICFSSGEHKKKLKGNDAKIKSFSQ